MFSPARRMFCMTRALTNGLLDRENSDEDAEGGTVIDATDKWLSLEIELDGCEIEVDGGNDASARMFQQQNRGTWCREKTYQLDCQAQRKKDLVKMKQSLNFGERNSSLSSTNGSVQQTKTTNHKMDMPYQS